MHIMRYKIKYLIKKKLSRFEKIQVGVSVVSALTAILLLVNAYYLFKVNDKMGQLYENAEIVPQLFVRDIKTESQVSFESDKVTKLEKMSVKYTISNKGKNSAFKVRRLDVTLYTDSIFFLDTVAMGNPTRFGSFAAKESFPVECDVRLYTGSMEKSGTITVKESTPIFLHFYYMYEDILGFEHKSYFIYKLHWKREGKYFIINNDEINCYII